MEKLTRHWCLDGQWPIGDMLVKSAYSLLEYTSFKPALRAVFGSDDLILFITEELAATVRRSQGK